MLTYVNQKQAAEIHLGQKMVNPEITDLPGTREATQIQFLNLALQVKSTLLKTRVQ